MSPERAGQGAAPPMRSLLFEGAVECREPGAGQCRLRGLLSVGAGAHARAGAAVAAPAELLLSGVRMRSAAPRLAPRLHALRVRATAGDAAAGGRGYALQLDAREGRIELQARTLCLQYDASGPFWRAIPPAHVPRLTRIGWAALLTALRVPLVSRLLSRSAG